MGVVAMAVRMREKQGNKRRVTQKDQRLPAFLCQQRVFFLWIFLLFLKRTDTVALIVLPKFYIGNSINIFYGGSRISFSAANLMSLTIQIVKREITRVLFNELLSGYFFVCLNENCRTHRDQQDWIENYRIIMVFFGLETYNETGKRLKRESAGCLGIQKLSPIRKPTACFQRLVTRD